MEIGGHFNHAYKQNHIHLDVGTVSQQMQTDARKWGLMDVHFTNRIAFQKHYIRAN